MLTITVLIDLYISKMTNAVMNAPMDWYWYLYLQIHLTAVIGMESVKFDPINTISNLCLLS